MPAGSPDLLKRGVGDAHAGPRIDQHQLPFQRGEPRGLFGDDRVEQ